MWTRKELKDKAKVSFRANYWKAVLVALLIVALGGSASSFSSGSARTSELPALAAISNTSDSASNQEYDYSYYYDDLDDYYYDDYDDPYTSDYYYYEEPSDDDFTGIAALLAAFGVMVIVLIVCVVIAAMNVLIFNPLLVGTRRFFVRNLNQKTDVKEVAYAFDSGNYVEIIKTMFFRDLFVILWSLLLIVPGIVKAYEYRMIPYLLAEDPTMTKDAAFAESKRMMTGQKWNAFVLDLSFLGWNILSACTMGILGVFYVDPYQAQTNAALYEKLRYGLPAPAQQAYVGAVQPPIPPVAGAPIQPYANAGYAAGAAASSAVTTAVETTEPVEQVEVAATQENAAPENPAQATGTVAAASVTTTPADPPASQTYWTAQSPTIPMAVGTASQPPIAPYAAIAADPYPQAASTDVLPQVPEEEANVAPKDEQA